VPDFRIRVVVDASTARSATDAVKGGLREAEGAADKLSRSVTRAIKTAAAAYGVREIVRLGDAYTNLQNRLRVVTDGTADLANATEAVFGIANRTRLSVTDTAEAFTRFSLALKDTDATQREVLRLTESVNEAIILSGASSAEASAGLIQFSQGLASGALRGDELRSVLEQLPAVADVIAKHLGVTRGQLRQMGAEGKITADVIRGAFAGAASDLDRQFGKTVPTIGQALTVLKNNVIKFLGELQKSTNIFGLLAKAVGVVADSMGRLGQLIGTIVGSFQQLGRWIYDGVDAFDELGNIILVPVLPAIAAAIVGVEGLTAAFVALAAVNPLVWIGGAIAAVAAFNEEISDAVEGTLQWANSWIPGAESIQDATVAQTIWFRRALQTNKRMIEQRQAVEETSKFWGEYGGRIRALDYTLGNFVQGKVSVVTKAFKAWGDAIGLLERKTPKVTKATHDFAEEFRAFEGSLDPAVAAMNAYDDALKILDRALGKGWIDQDRFNELLDAASRKAFGYVEQLKKVEEQVRKTFRPEFGPGVTGGVDFAVKTYDDVITKLERATELARMTTEQRQVEVALERILLDLKKQGLELDEQSIGVIREKLRAIQAINADQAREQRLLQFLDQLSTNIVDTALDADRTWSQFFHNLIRELERAILKAIVFRGIMAAAGRTPEAGALGLGGDILHALHVPGFAGGGQFRVGGAGGTDSQLMMFRATPNEIVTVQTPQQAQAGPAQQQPIQVGVYAYDNQRDLMAQFLASPPGERAIVTAVMRNRSRLGLT